MENMKMGGNMKMQNNTGKLMGKMMSPEMRKLSKSMMGSAPDKLPKIKKRKR